MSGRKPNPIRPSDVPTPIVVALVIYLLTVFVPVVLLRPDLPSALPPCSFRPERVLAAHAALRAAPPVAALDDAFDALAAAQNLHDPFATQLAQRTFASLVLDVAGDDPAARTSAREHQLRRFVARLDAGHTTDPLVRIAARHGLLGALAPPWATRAVLDAWFDLRWESAAARETLRGETVPLERAILRLDADERRAVVAWALTVDCAALLGALPAAHVAGAEQVEVCAHSRQEWIGLATLLDARYPVEPARAAAVALAAHELDALAAAERDPGRRAELQGRARELYGDASLRYRTVCEGDRSRLMRRYLLGTAQASGTAE